jgi:hypothetical protein
MNFMRLSSMKAAHVAVAWCRVQENPGISLVFREMWGTRPSLRNERRLRHGFPMIRSASFSAASVEICGAKAATKTPSFTGLHDRGIQ